MFEGGRGEGSVVERALVVGKAKRCSLALCTVVKTDANSVLAALGLPQAVRPLSLELWRGLPCAPTSALGVHSDTVRQVSVPYQISLRKAAYVSAGWAQGWHTESERSRLAGKCVGVVGLSMIVAFYKKITRVCASRSNNGSQRLFFKEQDRHE